MKKSGGLRKRWIMNTVGVVCILGIVCVLVVTAVFGAYYYSAMESDMMYRAQNSTSFFTAYLNQNYTEFYQSCVNYANSFESKNVIELQFIDTQGRIVTTSYGNWTGDPPATPEIKKAIETRQIQPYTGRDESTGEKIMAVSSPMIKLNEIREMQGKREEFLLQFRRYFQI